MGGGGLAGSNQWCYPTTKHPYENSHMAKNLQENQLYGFTLSHEKTPPKAATREGSLREAL